MSTTQEPEVWPYILPLGSFLAVTALEGSVNASWYPAAYAVKLVVVLVSLWFARGTLRDLLPAPSWISIALAIAAGLLVTALWVGLDGHYPEFKALGQRTAFDPAPLKPLARGFFLVVRMIGLVLVVPLIEELFYRSFLMRWIINSDISQVPIGKVTPLALAVTTGVFTGSHPEWLPALLTSLIWGGLLAKTKSVSACVVSHAAANLALGIYVLSTGAWKFW